MQETDLFSRLGVALAIGLMVGIERGWQSRDAPDDGRAAGLRTFGLTGLMGGITGVLSHSLGATLTGMVFVAFTAAFGAFSLLEARAKATLSATTMIAGMLTFLLGVLATVGDVTIAVAAAVAMTVLLALRRPLHAWIATLTWSEVRAGLVLMVMSFLLLPLLPDRAVDPWGAVNPHTVWLLAILTALISFVGYVAVRLFGDRLGIIVTAAAGGLASSTATTLTLARLARDQPAAVNLLSGGILISGAIMVARVAILATVLNGGLLGPLIWPLAAGFVCLWLLGLYFIFGKGGGQTTALPRLSIANPLEVGTSLRLAAFIVAVMIAAELVQRVMGDAGLLVVAALSGVADVDAITVATAQMAVALPLAAQAILLAVAVNTLAKASMAATIGGAALGVSVGVSSVVAVVAGVATYAGLA